MKVVGFHPSLLIGIILLCPSLLFCGNSADEAVLKNRILQICSDSVGMTAFPSVRGKHFRADCIGFVKYAYAKAGLSLEKACEAKVIGGVDSLYAGLEKRRMTFIAKTAAPGDLVFFDNTYDSNRNGAWDDPLSHLGIILSVDGRGTITYAHHAGGVVKTSQINLFYPKTHAFRQKDGSLKVINSFLRRQRGEGYEKKEYVSSSFFHGFARLHVHKRN